MEPLHWRSLGERYLSMSMESILIELSEFLDFSVHSFLLLSCHQMGKLEHTTVARFCQKVLQSEKHRIVKSLH